MVLVIMWVVAAVALLVLMIAWGASTDDAAAVYTRSRAPVPRGALRVVSSASASR